MRIGGSLSAKAAWRFHTVFDGGTFSDSGVSANFDVHKSYEWPVIRPRSAADAAHPDQITPINLVAGIAIHDTDTNALMPLSDANLNAYLRFDDSQWDWGPTPLNERGRFGFELLPDALGHADRVIALTYSPVPEPSALVLVGVSLGGWFARRQLLRNSVRWISVAASLFVAASVQGQSWTGLSSTESNPTGNWSPF